MLVYEVHSSNHHKDILHTLATLLVMYLYIILRPVPLASVLLAARHQSNHQPSIKPYRFRSFL